MKKGSGFLISMAAFFLSSIAAFWITLIDRQQHLALSNGLAILFWITLLSGIVFCVKSKSKVRLLNFLKEKR